jgi:hypothetical protein
VLASACPTLSRDVTGVRGSRLSISFCGSHVYAGFGFNASLATASAAAGNQGDDRERGTESE